MPFADPDACPSCAGRIAGEARCPHCLFDLRSETARDVWLALQHADALVDKGRRESLLRPLSAPDEPLAPPFPRSGPPPAARKRQLTTGSIILGLGAICLVVAALVFVTVSWNLLGATGRIVVLVMVTVAVAVAARLVTGRRLRASAEALWGVFFGLFTIDFFAARAYHLAGLDSLDGAAAVLLYGILAAAIGVGVTLTSRKAVTLALPAVIVGAAVWLAGFALVSTIERPFFWAVLAGFTLTAAAAVAARQLRMALTAVIAAPAIVILYLAAVGGAIVEMADSPHLGELTGGGHGLPMLVMVLVTAGIGIAVSRLIIPAAALVVLGVSSLLFTPAEAAYGNNGGFIAAAAIVTAMSVALIGGTQRRIRGARIGTLMILVAVAVASLGWLANAIEAVDHSNGAGFGTSWAARLSNAAVLPGPGWLALLVFAAMSAAVFAVSRWPEVPAGVPGLTILPFFIAGGGIVLGVIAFEPVVLVAALTTLAVGVAAAVLARTQILLGAALLLTVLPATMTFASKPVSLLIWLAVAAVLAGYARFLESDWIRRTASFGAAALLISAAVLAAEMLSLKDQGLRLTAVTTALLIVVLTTYALRSFVGRLPAEVAVAVALVVTLASGVDTPLGPQSFLWTVVGVPLVILGLLAPDRRILRYVGSVALGVAWVLRLLASDVEVVEAYTAPFAIALFAAGFWAMHTKPRLGTLPALTPGLTLALLPSVPQALDDPTGLRALLLGIAALAALGLGVWRKWKMPFLFGAAILALLVVWNVGPLANGLPRWALIAAAGAILVGVGITWESRVRDARSAAQYVNALR